MFCVRDPSGYSDSTVVVSPAAMFILSLCDGTHTRLEIQAEFTRRFGQLLTSEQLSGVLEQMASNAFLEGKQFEDHCRKTEREFRGLDSRPSAFAGKAFPEEGAALRDHLEAIFTGPDGSGLPDLTLRNGEMRGAIAPHIDYQRGARSYSTTYKAVGEEAEASLFVILGTAHAGRERIFTATRKHFETPMGRLRTDQESVDRLAERYGDVLFEDEIIHRSEHSIEFQAIFLQYLFGDRDISIIPILCGSFQPYVLDGRSPDEDPVVGDFIEALRETLKASGKRLFVLAGADLSHVGLKFGDLEPPTPLSCEKLKSDDHRTLEFAIHGDAEGFYRSIQEEGDCRKICGLSSIYTLLKTLDAPRGKILHYDQSPDPTLPSVVSHAAVVYY